MEEEGISRENLSSAHTCSDTHTDIARGGWKPRGPCGHGRGREYPSRAPHRQGQERWSHLPINTK